jgi:Tol biopolymer transport system component
MQVDRWQRVEALFHAASRLAGAERVRFLDESCCSDHDMRAEVESLLAYQTSAGAFIEVPALDVAARLMASDDVSLSGTTVGNFRVLDKLGEGGMGIVHEAVDIRLGRTVALKFLPTTGASPQALERFEREARAASALNHPNICTIYSVQDLGHQPFIEMERLEGETLRERIAARTLATDEVVSIALQIVAGLDAAHAKGIIHRDLKPGNIFCTDAGAVKILDFGIAKLDSAPDEVAAGVLGTIAYMSPEQASGETVDSRTDLFSLGAVIYEMATGRAAFQGASSASIRDAILNNEPIPPRRLKAALPVALERIILKTLHKNRDLRYQRASELRTDLERLGGQAGRRRRQLLSAAAILLVLVSGGLAWRYSLLGVADMFNVANVRVRQLTHNTGERGVSSGALSPDGRYIAYTDQSGIYVRTIETGETRKVPQPDNLPDVARWDLSPGWFPDGTRLVVNLLESDDAADSTMWLLGVSRAPQKLRDHSEAITVSPDGSWIAFATAGRTFSYRNVWLLSHDAATERKLFDAAVDSSIFNLSWSPDGRRVAYLRADDTAPRGVIEVRDVAGGSVSTIFQAVDPDELRGLAWLRDGRVVYSLRRPGVGMRAGTQPCTHWQIPVDNGTGRPLRGPSPLASWLPQCVGPVSLSADGTRGSYLLGALNDVIHIADLPADGQQIALSNRLTFTDGRNIPSGWTFDNTSLVFMSDASGRATISRQAIGADTQQAIVSDSGIAGAARVTPDGASVLYRAKSNRWRGPQRLMLVPIEGGVSREIMTGEFVDGGARCAVLPATLCAIAEPGTTAGQVVFTSIELPRGRGRQLVRFNGNADGDYRWALSPDGTRIAVLDAGEARIHVLSLTGMPSHSFDVKGYSTLGYVSWTADGNNLLVPSVDARFATLLTVDLQGNPRVLWQQRGALDISAIPSSDGRRVAIWVRTLSANLWLAETM